MSQTPRIQIQLTREERKALKKGVPARGFQGMWAEESGITAGMLSKLLSGQSGTTPETYRKVVAAKPIALAKYNQIKQGLLNPTTIA